MAKVYIFLIKERDVILFIHTFVQPRPLQQDQNIRSKGLDFFVCYDELCLIVSRSHDHNGYVAVLGTE